MCKSYFKRTNWTLYVSNHYLSLLYFFKMNKYFNIHILMKICCSCYEISGIFLYGIKDRQSCRRYLTYLNNLFAYSLHVDEDDESAGRILRLADVQQHVGYLHYGNQIEICVIRIVDAEVVDHVILICPYWDTWYMSKTEKDYLLLKNSILQLRNTIQNYHMN